MDPMKILAQLYDLLAQASTEELLHAARAAGTDSEIAQALKLLARYRRKSADRQIESDRKTAESSVSGPTLRATQPSVLGSALERRIRELIHSDYFPSNQELVRYLNSVGLPVKFNAKQGRKRIQQKLLSAIADLPRRDQRQVIMKLFRILPRSETSAWFDAIRRE